MSILKDDQEISNEDKLVQKIKLLIRFHSESIQEVKLLKEKLSEAEHKNARFMLEKEAMLSQINSLQILVLNEKALQKENEELRKNIAETIQKIDFCIGLMKQSEVND